MIVTRPRRVTRDPSDLTRETAVSRPTDLDPTATAFVICDMWDQHWCEAATRRVAEMAPRLNALAARLREQGVLIVHAPSGTLEQYRSHPARIAAIAAPAIAGVEKLAAWVHHDPSYEAAMPIDDTDGGCPCSPRCDEYTAWSREIDEIEIHDCDIIADGTEIFNVYAERGVENVIVTGVHTNMCVLGRPFGVRQSVRRGLNVSLVRDLTDTMYNPARRPWVDHFTGTDLVIRHIETYWCATITSDQILGGRPFRFSEDTRPSAYTR